MNGPLRRTYPHLGDAQPPTLETLPQAVAQNVAIARSRTRARIVAVVKADGYGHGACTVARAAVAAGAEWLGTTDIVEASELRASGLTVPILTWLNPSGVDAEAAAGDQIDVAIGSVDELEALLAHASSGVRVHLNLDTGMAREGCPMSEWDALISRARQGQHQGKIHRNPRAPRQGHGVPRRPPSRRPSMARRSRTSSLAWMDVKDPRG